MIEFEQAYRIAMDAARLTETERVGLDCVVGRILAEDVASDCNMPPFDKSAMDGYACRREDLANELTVVETIPSGCVPKKAVGENRCAKIMTGAVVPEGADCVFMVEYAEKASPETVRFTGERTRDNICLRGEDIRSGDVVARRGEMITPAHVAVLASAGCAGPLVRKKPRIGVISTGDEVVEPSEKPSPAQIRNSNGWQLLAQAQRMGLQPRYYGIASDRDGAIDRAIVAAAAENDVVVLSGGVSMGDYDLVPDALRRSGFELLFEKIAIKPGKPTVFGASDSGYCFGLPGNPVSTFVLFEVLVRPFLLKMMGCEFKPANIAARLAKTIRRKNTSRASWTPVALTDSGEALAIDYHGSAHIGALCRADGIVLMPVGVDEIAEGTIVHVRQI